MKRSWWVRFGLFLVVVVFSVVSLIPTAMNLDEDTSFPVQSKINLGLDLQGGLYMVLGIEFSQVYRDEIKTYGQRVIRMVRDEAGIEASSEGLNDTDPLDPKYTLSFADEATRDQARELMREFYSGFVRVTSTQGNTLEFALTRTQKTEIQEQSVGKSIEVIRNRIDEFGVNEPEIVSQGEDRIIVALPWGERY